MDIEEIEGVKTYILSLCSAIGGLEEVIEADGTVGQVYCPGDEALACLRDLKKAIRVDNQNNEKTVLKALVEYNVIENDIVPLILSFQKDRNEVSFRFILACIELLVPMTWPVEKSLEEEEEHDPNIMICYRKYKMDLLVPGVFETILALIMRSVRIPHRDRSIVDHTTIRLALYLFRNLTAIPDLNISQSATMEQIRMSRMQESLMTRYYEADVMEFLLTIASNSSTQTSLSEWNLLVLEALYNFIKHVDPKDVYLYRISDGLARGDLGQMSAKLSSLLTQETAKKRQRTPYTPTRHNRFGGTYVLDWDGKKRVTHKQVGGFADSSLLLEGEKKGTRYGQKRKLEDKGAVRKVYQNSESIMYLKLIAQSFIQSCFNAFYACIMKDMQREDIKIVGKDYIRYHYTVKWFLEYHAYEQDATAKRNENTFRLPTNPGDHDNKDFDFSLIAGVLDLKSVLFCLRHIRLKLDNKEWFEVQLAADCFRQMLLTIGVMAKSHDEEYQNIAEHIQSNLYYEQQHLDLLIEIVRCYKSQSNGYLRSIVVLTHVLLKLLDKYQQGKKMLFIRKKPRLNKPKKSRHTQEEETLIVEQEESEDEEQARDRQAVYKDHIFKFSAFEMRYVSTDVIYAYCSLLEGYMDLEPKYIAFITSMFHRIMVKKRAEFLFWKLPVLDLFNRILSDAHRMPKTKEFEMLIEFIQYSTYQFFKAAKVYPLLFVEALFPTIKSNRTMWELPDPISAQNEQDYLDDVNFIPSTSNQREKSASPENNNIIDDVMADYLFSTFDKKKQEEEANKSDDEQVRKHLDTTHRDLDMDDYDDTPMSDLSKYNGASFDLDVETNTDEVDKLLLDMGIGTN